MLLGLVEFMERQNHSLWIDIPVLANVAELSHSYPNALYYKEREFRLCCLLPNHPASSVPTSVPSATSRRYYMSAGLLSGKSDLRAISAKFNTSYSLTAESLLKINNQLQENEAAEGILQYTQMHRPQINIKPTWFEKLGRWEEALDAYSKMQLECPVNETKTEIAASLGRMRCLKVCNFVFVVVENGEILKMLRFLENA